MTTEEAYDRLAKLEMEDSDDAVALGLALGALIYYRNIANLPDCNTCQKKHTGCPYLPRFGEYTRINCPLYKKEGLPTQKGEKMYEYKDTVDLMLSDDYKLRFTAEYLQLKLRYEKLKAFANEIEVAQMKGWPEPIHDCPLELLRAQQKCMGEYLSCLEKRAIIEDVALPS